MMIEAAVFLAFVSVVALVAALLRASWVTAQPDEWLLSIRNGRVVRAGVGISIWRRPGDVLARFSSTTQRVRFSAAALSREHLEVKVDGFILWSVARDPAMAFLAFQKLGIANLDRPPRDLKSLAHLLTSSQHHAFQALLAAELRALVGSLALDELLTAEETLARGLAIRLASLSETLGIAVERTEILEIEPADRQLLSDLSARSQERVREEAANARLEAKARLRQREAEEARRAATDDAELLLAKAEGARQVSLREQQGIEERELAREATAARLFAARKEREAEELSFELDRQRRTADADRDASLSRQSADEQKSVGLREHELARFVAEQTSKAMGSWQIREGRWIQCGDDSPATAALRAILGVGEALGVTGTRKPS
jgi:hypothetical protein